MSETSGLQQDLDSITISPSHEGGVARARVERRQRFVESLRRPKVGVALLGGHVLGSGDASPGVLE